MRPTFSVANGNAALYKLKTKSNRRSRLLLIFVIIFVAFLGIVQLFLSNRLSNLGENLEQEKVKMEELIAENQRLERELGEKESLIVIAEEAKRFGFEKIDSVYYLVPQIPVAMK